MSSQFSPWTVGQDFRNFLFTYLSQPSSRRGLKFVSKNRKERIIAIADELSNTEEYDIIALQEIWVYADYEYVRESVGKYLPYTKFFYRLVNSLTANSRYSTVS